MERIRIKYFNDDIDKIEKIANGDWIDLRAAEDISFEKNDFKMIPLGIAMELPEGYEAHVVPRSSTFKNYGIIMTNSTGIIDNTYCGDNDQWKFPAYCLEPRNFVDGKNVTLIKKNDRICQFRIVANQPHIVFDTVSKLGNDDRNGFGSTGR